MRLSLVLPLLACAYLPPAAAQQPAPAPARQGPLPAPPPGSYRALQLANWERDRAFTLAMVDSMPERLYRFKPVPVVRDFAEQIEHAALDNLILVAGPVRGEAAPALGDSARYLNQRAALRETVNRAYDYVIGALRSLGDSDYVAETRLFGAPMPKWRVFDVAREHATWTLGQLVAYFRLNGMGPPRWRPF